MRGPDVHDAQIETVEELAAPDTSEILMYVPCRPDESELVLGVPSSSYLDQQSVQDAPICVRDPREHLIDQKWRQSIADLNRLVERGVITSGGTEPTIHSRQRRGVGGEDATAWTGTRSDDPALLCELDCLVHGTHRDPADMADVILAADPFTRLHSCREPSDVVGRHLRT